MMEAGGSMRSSAGGLRRPAAVLAVLAAAALLPVLHAEASTQTDSVEVRLLELINQGRSGVGKGAEVMHAGLRSGARGHSSYQASAGSLSHDGLSDRIYGAAPDPHESNGAPDDGFGLYCENVAYYNPGGASVTEEQVAQKFYSVWYGSSAHRNCMFDSNGRGFNAAGVGIYRDARGYWWATFDSVRDSTPPSGSAPSPPPPSSAWTRVQQSASAVRYAGSWATYESTSASGGTYRRSSTQGSAATYTFSGTGVRWIGIRSSAGGIAEVRLDGLLVANVDQYASANSWQRVLFERTGLSSGSHTLEVRVKGTKNSSSSGYRTYIDAFERYS
jgi:uncharacterized protein YkwD